MGRLLPILLLILAFQGCNKPSYNVGIAIHIQNQYQNQRIRESDFNTTRFYKCGNEIITLSKLNYIVSRFTFYRGRESIMIPKSIFCSGSESFFLLDSIPAGTYDSLAFQLGDNQPFNANDPNIVNMAWPSLMGGGFHFIQYEGHFLEPDGNWYGFTLHTGGNGLQPIRIVVKGPFKLYQPSQTLSFVQFIDRWINGPPHCFVFSETNYTMGVDSLMRKAMENGQYAFRHLGVK